MKQFLSIFGLLLIGAIVGAYGNHKCHSQTEYHVQLLDYNQVELMDQNHNLIKTTSLDSLAYYLNQDNL